MKKSLKKISMFLVITTLIALMSCSCSMDNGKVDNNGNTTSDAQNKDDIKGNGSEEGSNTGNIGNDVKDTAKDGMNNVTDTVKDGINDVKKTAEDVGDAMTGKNNK